LPAGRLSALQTTVSDAQTSLNDAAAQLSTLSPPHTDADTHRFDGDGKLFRCIHRASRSVSSNETAKAAQQTRAVSTGDGKRARVTTGPPAAAAAAAAGAAAGGGSAGVAGAVAEEVEKKTTTIAKYGRPCLPGLPEAVMGYMGSFVTTKTAIRLSKVNKETHQKATDETFGVFRFFSVDTHESHAYAKIKKLQDVKRLGKIHTARVDLHAPSVLPCVAQCLEASRATLTELRCFYVSSSFNSPTPAAPGAPGMCIDFPKLTHIEALSVEWLKYFSTRRWRFPALTTLEIGHEGHQAPNSVVQLLKASPNIRHLSLSRANLHEDSTWAGFIAALKNCPHITTITGLELEIDSTDRVSQLMDALSHWKKPENKDVRKQLVLCSRDPLINWEYGQEGPAPADINKWAAEVGCDICWSAYSVTVDCSFTPETAHPAPDNVIGQVTKELAEGAQVVEVNLGGTPLHESWRDKLVFPNAESLRIRAEQPAVLDSIPGWLVDDEGAVSRRFPAVESLDVSLDSPTFADMPAAPSKLSVLFGGLTSVRELSFRSLHSLAVACEVLSYLSVKQLERVSFDEQAEMESTEWPAAVPEQWALSCPHIDSLWVGRLASKVAVRSFIKLILTLRPAQAKLYACLPSDELEGPDGLTAIRAFAWECYEQVQAHYSMKEDSRRAGYWYGASNRAEMQCWGTDGHLDLNLVRMS